MQSDGKSKFLFRLCVGIVIVVVCACLYFLGFRQGRLEEMRGNDQFNLINAVNQYEWAQSGNMEKLTNNLNFLIYVYVDMHDKLFGSATNDFGSNTNSIRKWETARRIYDMEKTQVVSVASLTKMLNDEIKSNKVVANTNW